MFFVLLLISPLMIYGCEYLNSLSNDDSWSTPIGHCIKAEYVEPNSHIFQCINTTHYKGKLYSNSVCNGDPTEIVVFQNEFEYSCDDISCDYVIVRYYKLDDTNTSNTSCNKPNTDKTMIRPYALNLCLRVGNGVSYSHKYRMMTCDFSTNTLTSTGYNDSQCTQIIDSDILNESGCSEGFYREIQCFNGSQEIITTTSTGTASTTASSSTAMTTTAITSTDKTSETTNNGHVKGNDNDSVQIDYNWCLMLTYFVYTFCNILL